jgi:hypothetical protein
MSATITPIRIIAAIPFLAPVAAFAQTTASPTIDLTSIINTAIVGVLGIISAVFLAWLQSHMKDQAAALAVSNAVKNSLGAIQQAATSTVIAYHPTVTVPVTPQMAAGVQYVLDNAGDEAARLGITQEKIASKIDAQIGLANIVTNQATAANRYQPTPPDPAVSPPVVKVAP